MTVRTFLHLPPPGTLSNFGDVTTYVRRLWDALFRLRQGKLECVIEFTLTANVATTVLNRVGLSNQTVVSFDPKTANAAAEKAAGTLYVLTANRGTDAWTVTHANNAQADRSYQVSCIG